MNYEVIYGDTDSLMIYPNIKNLMLDSMEGKDMTN
jgi:DNA polymerase elongation subunit (family B)